MTWRANKRIGAALVAAGVVGIGAWVIFEGGDSGDQKQVSAAPVPAAPGGLHDVSAQAVSAAQSGIEEHSAGEFEQLSAPTGVLTEAGVAAGGSSDRKKPARLGSAVFLNDQVGLAARRALNAVSTTIQLAPQQYPGFKTPCSHITPLLTSVEGPQMAGEFNDGDGGCYIWINLLNVADISSADLCKLSLHELGHLSGLQHSKDPADVMYSPFVSKPTPPVCAARASAARK
jgi:hypothetical protein